MFLRAAKLEDVPALEELIRESVWALQRDDYSDEQISGALELFEGRRNDRERKTASGK